MTRSCCCSPPRRLAFGIDAWQAFLQALPVASQASLTDGRASWAKLQSVFGVVRMIGGSEALAWTLQAILMGAIAVLMAAIWRSKVSFEIKAAALVTGALLCTPYLFMYRPGRVGGADGVPVARKPRSR